jgi:hypothetical protein
MGEGEFFPRCIPYYPEDGGSSFPQYVGHFLRDYTASCTTFTASVTSVPLGLRSSSSPKEYNSYERSAWSLLTGFNIIRKQSVITAKRSIETALL